MIAGPALQGLGEPSSPPCATGGQLRGELSGGDFFSIRDFYWVRQDLRKCQGSPVSLTAQGDFSTLGRLPHPMEAYASPLISCSGPVHGPWHGRCGRGQEHHNGQPDCVL